MPLRLVVTGREQVTPALVRVTFETDAGEMRTAFAESTQTDRYLKLIFLKPGVDYPEPLDMKAIRRSLPPEDQPVIRTYTAVDPDPDAGTLAVEFVVHGDDGVAGPWAAAAEPGDSLLANGPGGGYAPDPSADWHLLAGDESGLPAIRAALEALPRDAVARVVVEVEGPDHEVDLPRTDDTQITWVHRGTSAQAAMTAAEGAAPPLLEAVLAVEWLPGRVQCFVHGEAQVVMHGIRPYLLRERGLDRDGVSISGYWRRGRNEEGFREWKQELRVAEGG